MACRYIFIKSSRLQLSRIQRIHLSTSAVSSAEKHFWDFSDRSMARHLLLHLHAIAAAGGNHSGAAAAVAAFLAVCALALALCASHSAPGAAGRLRRALASVSRRRTEPAIAAVHQVQPGGGEASPCVWQKGILMGGKCQLPDFSGVINYDPAGNLVAPPRPGRGVPAIGW